jgi:hypothetical protein
MGTTKKMERSAEGNLMEVLLEATTYGVFYILCSIVVITLQHKEGAQAYI